MKSKKRGKNLKLYKIHIIIAFILFLIILLIFSSYLLINNSITNPKSSNVSSFTIIILPDTQYYTQSYPEIFINQTKWIIENKDSLGIKFVIHEGDIVNKNTLNQWDIANYSLSLLESNNIPFSLIPGNHDSNDRKNYSNFNNYFPKERFESKSWYGGNFNNYTNNYQLQTINNISFLFINLNFCPNTEEISWANSILYQNPEKLSILTTHGYLKDNEPPDKWVYFCGSTEYLWNDLIKFHPNLRIVLSGHAHNEKRRIDYNIANKTVYQLLSDYQDEAKGGSGYLRIMTFYQVTNLIKVQTYSPYLNRYKKGNDSEFSLAL